MELIDIVQPYIANKFPTIERYIQPPDGYKMEYPCIVVEAVNMDVIKANNTLYKKFYKYMLKYIVKGPINVDENVVNDILSIPYCRLLRIQIVGGLTHYVFEFTM